MNHTSSTITDINNIQARIKSPSQFSRWTLTFCQQSSDKAWFPAPQWCLCMHFPLMHWNSFELHATATHISRYNLLSRCYVTYKGYILNWINIVLFFILNSGGLSAIYLSSIHHCTRPIPADLAVCATLNVNYNPLHRPPLASEECMSHMHVYSTRQART